MAKTGILIPVMSKGDSLREANFRHVLKMVQDYGHGADLAVAQQVGGPSLDCTSIVNEIVPDATVLTFESDDPLIHKSKLVNMATEHHRAQGCDYALMIDADIHCNVGQIVKKLNELDPDKVPVVKPLRFFIRLNLEHSEIVRQGGKVIVNTKDYPRKEVIDFPGAGTLAFSMGAFDKVGGMDEAYVGWGWEDTDFSVRLRKSLPWKTFSDVGFHLEHENDRVINQTNFNRFHTSSGKEPDWNKMSVHVAHKLCVFSYGRCGSTMLALGLNEHPDVNFFSAVSDNDRINGCTEMFAAEHFRSEFPPSWSHETIVKYIGKQLTSDKKANVSGFKLMCGQPDRKGFGPIFSYIKNPQNRFSTVHVYRRDLLEQLCSWFVAKASAKWVKSYGDFKTEIDIDELKDKARQNLTFAEKIIEGCPNTFHVAYEDLVDDWTETMWKVQKHLALAPMELPVTTERQRDASEGWETYVTNYEEVRDAFDIFEEELRTDFPRYCNIAEKS